MDIGSGHGWPESELSNFPPAPFMFQDLPVASMEGLLQSFKFTSSDMQKHVMTLVGRAAKFKGKKKNWWRTQTLWWMGEEIDRHGEEYQKLLDEAFVAMFTQNAAKRRALLASGDAVLTHSMGKNDPHKTVLTTTEFCRRLTRIRADLKSGSLLPIVKETAG